VLASPTANVKVAYNIPLLEKEEGSGTDLDTYNLGSRSGRVVNATSVAVIGGWMGLVAG